MDQESHEHEIKSGKVTITLPIDCYERKDGKVAVVDMKVTLPIDCYKRIGALASILGVTVSHAAALTIFAGQKAQDQLDLDRWKERLRKS